LPLLQLVHMADTEGKEHFGVGGVGGKGFGHRSDCLPVIIVLSLRRPQQPPRLRVACMLAERIWLAERLLNIRTVATLKLGPIRTLKKNIPISLNAWSVDTCLGYKIRMPVFVDSNLGNFYWLDVSSPIVCAATRYLQAVRSHRLAQVTIVVTSGLHILGFDSDLARLSSPTNNTDTPEIAEVTKGATWKGHLGRP
jgi:hypothetical protein